MNQHFLTKLRDAHSDTEAFRAAAQPLMHELAQEALRHLQTKSVRVTTPVGKTSGTIFTEDVVLLPILRSGLAMLPVFLLYFPAAHVGFMGLKRDEKTAVAQEYYRNIPKLGAKTRVIILDPMLATGGSACDTLLALKQSKMKLSRVTFVSMIAAPEGVRRVKKEFPEVDLMTGVVDEKLNGQKYIVPGIGDFGDRYFGTV